MSKLLKEIFNTQSNKLLSLIERDASPTAVFTFGRFNPFTVGHLKLAHKLGEIARQNKAEVYIFASKTQDSEKNPLTFEEKISVIKQALEDNHLAEIIVDDDSNVKTIFDAAKKLDSLGYINIIGVFGDDRVEEFQTNLSKYNNTPTKKGEVLYTFNSISIVSAGARDPDSDDDLEAMSASKARALAVTGDYEGFKKAIPIKDDNFIANLFNLIKQRLGKFTEGTNASQVNVDPKTLEKYLNKIGVTIRNKDSATTWTVEDPDNNRFEKIKKFLAAYGGSENRGGRDVDFAGYKLKFKDLKKNTVAKEQAALANFIDSLEAAMNELNTNVVKLRDDEGNVYSIAGVENTPGTPKSDFHLVDEHGRAIFFISHKDGYSPKHFQQWSGTSASREPNIASHEETLNFVKALKRKVGNTFSDGEGTYGRKIQDDYIKACAIYGNDYGEEFGINNVNVCIQGPGEEVGFAIKNNRTKEVEIVAPVIHWNGDVMNGTEYEPIFVARNSTDRSDFGILGARIVINPLEGRNVIFI